MLFFKQKLHTLAGHIFLNMTVHCFNLSFMKVSEEYLGHWTVEWTYHVLDELFLVLSLFDVMDKNMN